MSREGNEIDEPAEENTFKILVATDIHLGFEEKNPIRGQDSFTTFEEILQLAVENKVDFLLLGGDLFHDSKPSPYCVYKCLELLRTHCLGDKPVEFEFLSDQSCNFQFQRNPVVNYEDPNLNVAVPVFSIHGNHDDPTGHRLISAMDIISTCGLINYFGRWTDLTQVEVRPILLKKGTTKLALYGLSHIKDERMGRLFLDKKVLMKRPSGDDWFNLLVLHQNRAARGAKNFIPESAFPDFMHLLIWGHEHDCRIEPENVGNDVFVSQPGSSIATSLSAGEAIPKKVGLLKIYKDQFKMIPIPLKTVRPFIIDELILENVDSENYSIEKPTEQAIESVKQKIRKMIAKAAELHTDSTSKIPLPLLRLKVLYYSEEQQFNTVRIGMQFADKVANPDDIIKFFNYRTREKKFKPHIELPDEEIISNMEEWANSAEDVVLKYFEANPKAMSVLSAKGLTEAVTRYTKNSDDSFSIIIDKQLKTTVEQIVDMDPNIDGVLEAIEICRQNRLENTVQNPLTNQNNESNVVITVSDNVISQEDEDDKDALRLRLRANDYLLESDSEDELPRASLSSRARGGRGSRSRAGRAGRRARGRGARNAGNVTLDEFFI